MKFSQKLSISLFAATASVLSFSSGAFAGEGGAAGAAAFTIDNTGTDPAVTGVAVAASVGKNDASAAAFNDVTGQFNSAFALGSAGPIDMQGIGDPAAAAMIGGEDPIIGTAQENQLTGAATIQLGTGNGDVIATIPDSGTTTTP
ncbi:MAG: hypothetical protein WBA41_18055 [Rivularia sp. (in: cyanobacteria)]